MIDKDPKGKQSLEESSKSKKMYRRYIYNTAGVK